MTEAEKLWLRWTAEGHDVPMVVCELVEFWASFLTSGVYLGPEGVPLSGVSVGQQIVHRLAAGESRARIDDAAPRLMRKVVRALICGDPVAHPHATVQEVIDDPEAQAWCRRELEGELP